MKKEEKEVIEIDTSIKSLEELKEKLLEHFKNKKWGAKERHLQGRYVSHKQMIIQRIDNIRSRRKEIDRFLKDIVDGLIMIRAMKLPGMKEIIPVEEPKKEPEEIGAGVGAAAGQQTSDAENKDKEASAEERTSPLLP